MKAGGNVATNGDLSKSFNNVGGNITVARMGKGYYVISIPGLKASDHVVATINEASFKGLVSCVVSGDGSISAYTGNLTGFSADHAFSFMIY